MRARTRAGGQYRRTSSQRMRARGEFQQKIRSFTRRRGTKFMNPGIPKELMAKRHSFARETQYPSFKVAARHLAPTRSRKAWTEINTRSPRKAREQRKLITSVGDRCGLMSGEITGCCDYLVENSRARRMNRRKKIILPIARVLRPFFKNAKKLSSSEKKRKRRLLHRSHITRRAHRVIS